MLHKLKENLPTIEILLGYFIYLFLILESTLSIAILWMIFIIYTWLFTTIFLDKYKFNNFINFICVSGIVVAITIFFIKGIEELPYPEGALIFHIEGIVKAFLLFFISTTPLIILNIKTNEKNNKETNNKKPPANKKQYDSNQWEEATLEEVNSGNFETIYIYNIPLKENKASPI